MVILASRNAQLIIVFSPILVILQNATEMKNHPKTNTTSCTTQTDLGFSAIVSVAFQNCGTDVKKLDIMCMAVSLMPTKHLLNISSVIRNWEQRLCTCRYALLYVVMQEGRH